MASKRAAEEIFAELEARSRRARPFLVIGLVAVIVSLIASAFYLERAREAAEARAAAESAKVARLTTTLEQARRIVAAPVLDRGRLSRTLRVAIGQADDLGTTVAEPALPSSEDRPALPPVIRIFIQINSEDQRAQAESIARGMAGQHIGETTVIVPGVELVQGRGDNSLRCMTQADCAHVDQVAEWVNRHVASPQIRSTNLSARYEHAGVARGTYELWFGPDPIEDNAP